MERAYSSLKTETVGRYVSEKNFFTCV